MTELERLRQLLEAVQERSYKLRSLLLDARRERDYLQSALSDASEELALLCAMSGKPPELGE